MRSLKYLPALLPLQFLNAYAGRPDADTTVVVTSTRTITICPITELFTCEADVLPTTTSKSAQPTSVSVTTTKSGGGSGNGTTTSHSGFGSTTTTYSGSSTLTTTSGSHDSNGTTTSHSGITSTTTVSHSGNGTTTSYTSTITTTAGNATTTTGITTTSGNSTTTTTTTQCQNSTQVATGIAEPRCNDASDRSVWCGGKTVKSDTHDTFTSRQTKNFELVIEDGQVDFDGTGPKAAFTINGGTPGPAIVANWGDTVIIKVTNKLTHNATTIHWHGIRQIGTNDQDGVPGVTECAIAPGQSRTYTWVASTYGTGWYHSHTLAQYGGGIRGPIIIHGPASANYDLDMGTVMIDETFSQTIFQMAYNIARVRGALPPSTNYMLNGKNKSPDGTKGEASKWVVKKGKKHLFRIINSSAQTGFAVHFDNHKMTVISADFTPIVPYVTETLWLGSGQRYNVIVEMDQPEGAYYLRAVTQTGCGITCANNGLGNSNGIFSYEGSCAQPTASNFTLTTTGICKDEPIASLVPVVAKSGGSSDSFSATAKVLPGGNAAGQNFDGYGSVNRWFLGGPSDLSANSGTLLGSKTINVTFDQPTLKTLATVPDLAYNSSIYSNAVVLDGVAGDWVYFVIQNNFQTSHPMHLHGHDFSVLGQGTGVFTAGMVGQLNFVNPIRRDTALLTGFGNPTAFTSGWTVIGFQTDNPGAWVMHCHIIWHADGGMGLQYLERPSEIDASKYYNSAGFQDECAAYSSYQANGGEVKAPYEAGIKRHIEDHKFHGYSHGHAAVRHS